ncbi:MAG: hypothetical protein ACK4IS_01710 [Erythrobacter sp.]
MITLVQRLAAASLFAAVGLAAPAAASTVGGAPLIPEPMVFDMIRPLAAPRGELEANALALFPLNARGEDIDWAPEIEYAFANGWAAEFELPFDNERLTGYKFALQGTIGTFAQKRGVHGVQAIAVVDRETGRLDTSLLYIAGVRYSEKWSTLTMVGLNRPADPPVPGARRDDALLINHSLFYDAGKHTVVGVETNLRSGRASTKWLMMPQVHQRLSEKVMIQAGLGAQKVPQRAAHPTAAVRLIREF